MMDQGLFGTISVVVGQLLANLNAIFSQQNEVWLVTVEYGFGDEVAISRVINESS